MTATTTPPEALEPSPRRRDIDPEHDIDAKKTIAWLAICALSVFVCLWVLLQLYKVVIFDERQDKVETLEPIGLEELRQQEEVILRGGMREDGTPAMSIEQAMKELVDR